MSDAFATQASTLVAENRHLRIKSENDDNTIGLMKQQYDLLAASVQELRSRHDRELRSIRDAGERERHILTTERDHAVRAHTEINGLLAQVADLTMQAIRASKGDVTPENIPDRPIPRLADIPVARLS